MGFRSRLKMRASAPSKPADNPYITARSNFESVFRSQAKEKHAWRLASLAELVIIGVLVVAYMQLASGSRVVPYVIEVDKLGQVAAIGPAGSPGAADPRVVARELSALVRNLRSITPDGGLQLRMIQDAYAFLDATAARFLNEYFADPANNPRILGQSLTRTVEVMSVLPIPDSKSWKVQWTESERRRTGSISRSRVWEAYLTVKQVPPTTADAIQTNPLGIYVTGINWTPIHTPSTQEGAP